MGDGSAGGMEQAAPDSSAPLNAVPKSPTQIRQESKHSSPLRREMQRELWKITQLYALGKKKNTKITERYQLLSAVALQGHDEEENPQMAAPEYPWHRGKSVCLYNVLGLLKNLQDIPNVLCMPQGLMYTSHKVNSQACGTPEFQKRLHAHTGLPHERIHECVDGKRKK